MLMGRDVSVTLDLPEGSLGISRRERLGVLEGHHFVLAGVDDHERNPFARKLSGFLFRPHRPGVYAQDRKSTRLNSSHANISYAVFCLKKKKNNYTALLL